MLNEWTSLLDHGYRHALMKKVYYLILSLYNVIIINFLFYLYKNPAICNVMLLSYASVVSRGPTTILIGKKYSFPFYFFI